MIKNYFNILLKAILAGILIALAGTIYLSLKSENAIIGAFLFGFGLLTIVGLDFKLYTGRVGYVIDEKPSYLIEILIIIIGNSLGGLLIASFVHLGNMQNIILTAQDMVTHKLSKELLPIFGLSILCGMMMYLGVEGYKRVKNDVARTVLNIFAVAIFILAGFEHSIANIFYFFVANLWTWYMFVAFLVMLLGNAVGAIILNGIEKLANTKKA